ncbi:hypothetical protein [Falsiroseomonas sp. HW251]|uniref:hypothetical protein n=1 Tax=Falsiroseomonas sp. HW251 TaxID=3390998 RepID=UPI003D311338
MLGIAPVAAGHAASKAAEAIAPKDRPKDPADTAPRVWAGAGQLTAAQQPGADAPPGQDWGDALIAFCRPQADAGRPCLCSIEQIETPVTPGQFVLLMRGFHRAGAASAAELRLAERQAREACGDDAVAASLDAAGRWASVSPEARAAWARAGDGR